MDLRLTELLDPAAAGGRRAVWLATAPDGRPVGVARLRLPDGPGQGHLAELDLHVHPAERRCGAGTRLLDAALGTARGAGRRSVLAQVVGGSGGEAFAAAHGFRQVLALTYVRLDLAAADLGALRAEAGRAHPGYRLVDWRGTVPDGLAGTYAASRRAMDDMPTDGADLGRLVWDVDRVRAVAQAVADRGEHLHTVAAVEEASGDVVGFTELVAPPGGRGDALHYGTAVLPAHRGRGLARWMKAAAALAAREQHPGLAGLLADTADANEAMRRVNAGLGYVPTHRSVEVQRDL
ncbi:GNAT family N-acetyltransferase [Vallicoccus soli]|uniref:GNAT family N-acetyltransferase n=1 Tax=Vallicoccus soli TaxID=2339232 RepID=A0A3A3YZV7_9ACTN|nr:GNAT family N-acetyltransferase [Vallicoccus soli]RJK97509.1 GNAT family N-acetyltransferase [Vallicoccus soli]